MRIHYLILITSAFFFLTHSFPVPEAIASANSTPVVKAGQATDPEQKILSRLEETKNKFLDLVKSHAPMALTISIIVGIIAIVVGFLVGIISKVAGLSIMKWGIGVMLIGVLVFVLTTQSDTLANRIVTFVKWIFS